MYKLNKYRKVIVIVIVVLMVLGALSAATLSFAEGGNNPLTIESSTPSDGDLDVSKDAEIVIVFSKNIVNMAVKENNAKCFTMNDNEGNDTPLDIVMADDQIDREKRHDVQIIPANGLKEGKQYTINISKDMSAKNGNILGEDKTITFSTAGYVADDKSDNSGQVSNNKYYLWIAGFVIVIVVIYIFKRNK